MLVCSEGLWEAWSPPECPPPLWSDQGLDGHFLGGHMHRAQEGWLEGAGLEGLLCTLQASRQAGGCTQGRDS